MRYTSTPKARNLNMCGVLGVSLDDVTSYQVSLVRRVMKETQIRGKHASGVAYHNGKNLVCVKRSIPINELSNSLQWEAIVYGGHLKMIAHARYSTSDMKFHQPLGDFCVWILGCCPPGLEKCGPNSCRHSLALH